MRWVGAPQGQNTVFQIPPQVTIVQYINNVDRQREVKVQLDTLSHIVIYHCTSQL